MLFVVEVSDVLAFAVLSCVALRCVALRCVALRCVGAALHCVCSVTLF